MRRSGRSMFSLCSVPSACLQNAISSSAKTARPRRGALDIAYGRPALRLPGSRRALGLAKQGLKSHCKRRSGQSRCRENMDLPLLTMWRFSRKSSAFCCVACNIKMTRGLTLCHICLHKSFRCVEKKIKCCDGPESAPVYMGKEPMIQQHQ